MLNDVRFRIVTPADYFTPLCYISVEHIRLDIPDDNDNTIRNAIVKEFDCLNINPDHIRIEDKYRVEG